MGRFDDRTWVVTGGASGIGRACTELLRQRGARVVVFDLADAGGDAEQRRVDVTDADAVHDAFAGVAAEHGSIDGVLHSAGILRAGMFTELPVAEQLKVVQVNVGGTIAVAHAAIPHLRRTRGSLVMMGSASAFHGPPEFAAYGATKAAVISLAQALRIELEDDGVHVATCNPLFTETAMLDESNRKAALVGGVGVLHTPDDVAAAIVRGIERRSSMILPGVQPRAMHVASSWLGGIGHPLMRMTWRRARSAAARRAARRS